MLAYIFWHWQIPTTETSTYEASLIHFHRTLSAHKARRILLHQNLKDGESIMARQICSLLLFGRQCMQPIKCLCQIGTLED